VAGFVLGKVGDLIEAGAARTRLEGAAHRPPLAAAQVEGPARGARRRAAHPRDPAGVRDAGVPAR
jgi:hypothetical protein